MSPLFYGVVYILAIPLFALAYYFTLSSSFYAPYARFEPSAITDLLRIGEIINTALHRALDSRKITIQGWQLKSIMLVNFHADASKFLFDVMAVFQKQTTDRPPAKDDQQYNVIRLPASISADIQGVAAPRPDDPTVDRERRLEIDVSSHPPTTQQFETEFYNTLLPSPFFLEGRILLLTPIEDAAFDKFFLGVRGNPTVVSEGFFRMLYFSATVITTIGFGDIVPITPPARLFVAIEGIFGVILVGLFVNAVARQASRVSARGNLQ
jgi:hypothetical protein